MGFFNLFKRISSSESDNTLVPIEDVYSVSEQEVTESINQVWSLVLSFQNSNHSHAERMLELQNQHDAIAAQFDLALRQMDNDLQKYLASSKDRSKSLDAILDTMNATIADVRKLDINEPIQRDIKLLLLNQLQKNVDQLTAIIMNL